MPPWCPDGPGLTQDASLPHEAGWGSVVEQLLQGEMLLAEFLITNAELQVWSPTSACVKQVQGTWWEQEEMQGAGENGTIKCRRKAPLTLSATVADSSTFMGSGVCHPASTGSKHSN